MIKLTQRVITLPLFIFEILLFCAPVFLFGELCSLLKSFISYFSIPVTGLLFILYVGGAYHLIKDAYEKLIKIKDN